MAPVEDKLKFSPRHTTDLEVVAVPPVGVPTHGVGAINSVLQQLNQQLAITGW